MRTGSEGRPSSRKNGGAIAKQALRKLAAETGGDGPEKRNGALGRALSSRR